MPADLVSDGNSLSQVTSWMSRDGRRSPMLTGVSHTAAWPHLGGWSLTCQKASPLVTITFRPQPMYDLQVPSLQLGRVLQFPPVPPTEVYIPHAYAKHTALHTRDQVTLSLLEYLCPSHFPSGNPSHSSRVSSGVRSPLRWGPRSQVRH